MRWSPWLGTNSGNSHDPDFQAKAREICRPDLDAPHFDQHGRLVLCCDEKRGMQILDRAAPTPPPAPGRPERREFESIRLGTGTMLTTFVVPTGEVVSDLGPTRTSLDLRAHVLRVAAHCRDIQRFDWVVDNLSTHQSLSSSKNSPAIVYKARSYSISLSV